jgi:Flp pilus assembly protein TadD
MFWVIILVALVIMVIVALVTSSRQKNSATTGLAASTKRYIERDGEVREANSVFDAWTSGDLSTMMAQLNQKTTLVDRHFLLMNIVAATYKGRDDPEMRAVCRKIAQMHIDEFPRIKPALKRSLGVLPRVPTFQQYATVLTEEQRFEEAIAVCEKALKFGLSDGTKGDFEGRIELIKKKRNKKT